MKVWCAIDNGVSGSVGLVYEDGRAAQFKMPVRHEPSYTKKKQFLNRIDYPKLVGLLKSTMSQEPEGVHAVITDANTVIMVLIERPMINPTRFVSTMSALRALEATLIAVEQLKLPYQYIDSKEWQKAMLPSGLQGPEQLKEASAAVGRRLAPMAEIQGRDADGLLMAFYAKKIYP